MVWTLNIKDPHLLSFRDNEYHFFILFNILIASLSILITHKYLKVSCLLVVSTLVIIVSFKEYRFGLSKLEILSNRSNKYNTINQRLIVGYDDKEQLKTLIVNEIAGIFLTSRNIQNETQSSLKSFIEELQKIRNENDLPPLIIATDQEGGPVSRLSPLIERQKTLALATSKGESGYEYGKKQGSWLNALGVNVNFSPVVDLKPDLPPSKLDFHSLIATRAISSDPKEVLNIALAYVKGLKESEVTATLKHFPGLARVQTDTHHFSARLSTDIETLLETDLLPFTEILKSTSSWLMLSHVILEDIDSENPITTSHLVIDGLIRSKLGINNTLITDDLTMGATYNPGFCKSVVQSYSTSVDYLLIAYDYEKYFNAVKCIESHNKIYI